MDRRPLESVAACLAAFAALGILAYSCAVNPVTGRSELSIMSFSQEEEVNLGAKAYVPAVQQQGGFYRDKALEDYVQGVGMRVARVSHRPELDYRYRVLNSSVPNAFALPGGFIVINRGLLVGLSNEAEMAAVSAELGSKAPVRWIPTGLPSWLSSEVVSSDVSLVATDSEPGYHRLKSESMHKQNICLFSMADNMRNGF